MMRKRTKQEIVEAAEAIFLTKILSSFLFNNDIDMEFPEIILSSTSSSTNKLSSNVGSTKDSIDFECVNDFYGSQFQDEDVEIIMYLTNDYVFDKLLILLGLNITLIWPHKIMSLGSKILFCSMCSSVKHSMILPTISNGS